MWLSIYILNDFYILNDYLYIFSTLNWLAYFESDGLSGSLDKGCVLRSPTYTFTTGETIRVCFGIATTTAHSFVASDAFFLGVG